MLFFLFLVFLVFSVFGLCEFLHLLHGILIFPKRKMNSTLVIMLDEQNAEKQIAFAGEQLKWLGGKYAERVIAVAQNLSDDALQECAELSLKYHIKLVVKGRE